MKCCIKSDEKRERLERKKKMLEKDVYVYQLDYSIAFSQLIFTLTLLYSMLIPPITLFGAIYFYFKYIIDRYNLTIIYPKNYQSKGKLSRRIINYTYVSLYIQQVTMISIMSVTLGINGLELGYFIVVI